MAGAGARPRRVSKVPDEEAFDQTAAAREHRADATRAQRAQAKRLGEAHKRGTRHGSERARQKPFGRAKPEPEFEDAEAQEQYEHAYRQAHRDTQREFIRGPEGLGGLAHQGAGFILGLLGWTLALQYIRAGNMSGVTDWLKAKFLNETTDPSGGTGDQPAPAKPAAPSNRVPSAPNPATNAFPATPAAPAGHV